MTHGGRPVKAAPQLQPRIRGKFMNAIARSEVVTADPQQISACHCEERSDVAIRISCGSTKQCANISGKSVEAANLP